MTTVSPRMLAPRYWLADPFAHMRMPPEPVRTKAEFRAWLTCSTGLVSGMVA